MKLYHPDAITQDLLERLDPPVRDMGDLTADLELPVRIKGDVVADGAEISLTSRITACANSDRFAAEQTAPPRRKRSLTASLPVSSNR